MDTSEIRMNKSEGAEKIGASLWFFFIIALLSNILGGTVSTLMAVYLPVVVRDLLGKTNNDFVNHVSAYINSVYIIGWTAGGFLWGMISDRAGRIKSFLVSLALYGLLTLLIGFMYSWEMVVLLRLLSGFCVGGVLVITNIYLTEVWPEKSRAVYIGFLSIGFPIGIFSAGLINYIFKSWRTGFMIGLIPAGIAILSALFIWRSEAKAKGNLNPVHDLSLRAVFNDNHKNLILGSILFGSMLIGMWAVFSWLPTWIQSLLNNSSGQKERGLGMMLMGIGGLAGGFISGYVARIFGMRKSMLVCFVGCLVTALIMFGINRTFSNVIYFEIALITVFFGISQGLLATYVPQLFKPAIRGSATGFCFNTGRIFTAVAVFFVGALVSFFGGYSNTLLAFSTVFLFGMISVYFSKDLQLNP